MPPSASPVVARRGGVVFPPPSRRVARLPALVPLHPLLLLSGDVGGGVGLGALKQREDQGGVRLVGGGVANDCVVLEGKDISGYGKYML